MSEEAAGLEGQGCTDECLNSVVWLAELASRDRRFESLAGAAGVETARRLAEEHDVIIARNLRGQHD